MGRYDTICTICLRVFRGREQLLKHYEEHNESMDEDGRYYQFNWESRNENDILFSSYPIGNIWICKRCDYRNLVECQRLVPMQSFDVKGTRLTAEVCDKCKTPRFVDFVRFGWRLPALEC